MDDERRGQPEAIGDQARVLVAKIGLDGHDVGAKAIAIILRNAGLEVIYMGIRQTPEAVVRAVLDEDVDVLGLSILSGAHLPLLGRVMELLAVVGEQAPPVVVGGVIPAGDVEAVRSLGVRALFSAADSGSEIVAQVRALVAERRAATETGPS